MRSDGLGSEIGSQDHPDRILHPPFRYSTYFACVSLCEGRGRIGIPSASSTASGKKERPPATERGITNRGICSPSCKLPAALWCLALRCAPFRLK